MNYSELQAFVNEKIDILFSFELDMYCLFYEYGIVEKLYSLINLSGMKFEYTMRYRIFVFN